VVVSRPPVTVVQVAEAAGVNGVAIIVAVVAGIVAATTIVTLVARAIQVALGDA
jgi:hypothetical protein